MAEEFTGYNGKPALTPEQMNTMTTREMMDYYGGNDYTVAANSSYAVEQDPRYGAASTAEQIGNWWYTISGNKAANDAAAAAAREAREHDDAREDSKVQRTVDAYRAAGLNPATLAGFSGASFVPSSSQGVQASTHGSSGNILSTIATVIGMLLLKGKASSAKSIVKAIK